MSSAISLVSLNLASCLLRHGCKISLMKEQKIFFTFSTRSFFCRLIFGVALLLIRCTRHVVSQLLEAIFGGIF